MNNDVPNPASHLSVERLIKEDLLYPVFQPIASLIDGKIFGHEALIRGPSGSRVEFPDALFRLARQEDLSTPLEIAAVRAILKTTSLTFSKEKLFFNLSAQALMSWLQMYGVDTVIESFKDHGVDTRTLVIELTEHERVTEIDRLQAFANPLKAHGVSFALDDFGDGRSSLRLWAEMEPAFVKVDKFFTNDLRQSSYKRQTLKAVVQIAEILGGTIVAEGIETGDDLAVIRDLGITLGQGYFLSRPSQTKTMSIFDAAIDEITKREVPVLRASQNKIQPRGSVDRLMLRIAPVTTSTTTDQVVEMFRRNPHYRTIAVVDELRPVGLIERRSLMDRYSQPYQKERFGRRSCTAFMNPSPILLERGATMEDMMQVLMLGDQQYLHEGFIVTENGHYAGVGTGEQLVRAVTEYRVEAARHANPLTFLPGNVPITEHIGKLLARGSIFTCSYCDLNHFKPFNDQYGYWRGDEMIRRLASVAIAHAEQRRDFVGHVGGDDFVVLYQSEDWLERCQRMLTDFNRDAMQLFDEEAIRKGGIESEDRNGRMSFFPLTTLSIGVVVIRPGMFRRAEDVASAAAAAKRHAKRTNQGLWVIENPHDVLTNLPHASDADQDIRVTVWR